MAVDTPSDSIYCKNHEPSLPPLIKQLPAFEGPWTVEPTAIEMSIVLALAKKVGKLKRLRLTGVSMHYVRNLQRRRAVTKK
jgi:hypothetical protein